MLSRHAEALYWMARNLERADGIARLLATSLRHGLEVGDDPPEENDWRALLDVVDAGEPFHGCYPDGAVDVGRVVQFLIGERAYPSSLRNCIRVARANARLVRHCLPLEVWSAINGLWLGLEQGPADVRDPWQAIPLCAGVQREVAQVFGLAQGMMLRDEAQALWVLGSLHERADMTARTLAVGARPLVPGGAGDSGPGPGRGPALPAARAAAHCRWVASLQSLGAFEAYRRRHRAELRIVEVVSFLVLSSDLPRSLAFCIERMGRALARLDPPANGAADGVLHALRRQLEGMMPQDILGLGVHAYLEGFLDQLARLTEAIQHDYFDAGPGDP